MDRHLIRGRTKQTLLAKQKSRFFFLPLNELGERAKLFLLFGGKGEVESRGIECPEKFHPINSRRCEKKEKVGWESSYQVEINAISIFFPQIFFPKYRGTPISWDQQVKVYCK